MAIRFLFCLSARVSPDAHFLSIALPMEPAGGSTEAKERTNLDAAPADIDEACPSTVHRLPT
jgi:hypothetical protein